MKVLVVDDSTIIRRSIERTIATRGYQIRTAANGRLALSVFNEFEPDFVTMDITMPEMDGLTCVTEMLKRRPAVRILVVSALADKLTAIEAVKRGARGFLLKPFTPAMLDTEVRELFID
jgi:two-component system chemotaxis response regulator CheY